MTDLFGNEIVQKGKAKKKPKPKKVEKVEWSPSRTILLRQCNRKYYYKHYGSLKFKAKEQPFKEELAFCKSLTNKFLMVGKVIHSAIAKYYRDILKEDFENDCDDLISFAEFILGKVIEYSEKKSANPEHVGSKYDTSILMEIYNGTESSEEIEEFAILRIHKAIKNFFKEKYSFLREIPEGAHVEKKFSIYPLEHCKITGVLDLGFEIEDEYLINDWKTGFVEVENTSLQMLTYALWAKEEFPDRKITLFKTYLIEDEIKPLEFSERQLLRARTNLIQDCEEMLMLDEFGRKGNFNAFGKCNQEKICNQCPYQTVCIKN